MSESSGSSRYSAPTGGMSASNDVEDHKHEEECSEHSLETYSTRHIVICLIGYSLAFIIFGSQVSILGPTIKPLAEHLGVDKTDLSPLFTALGISCIVSGWPSGWLVDRLPAHQVLVGSLLVEAIGFSLVPFMPSVWSLTALYFIICFSYNFTNSAVFTALGWMFPKRAGSALNLVLAMFGVGSFFIPLAAEACKHLFGTALAVFWVIGVLSLIAASPFMFVSSPTRPAPVHTTHVLGKLNQDKQGLEVIVTTAVVLLVFCTTAAETAVGNWIYSYAAELGVDDQSAAFANSVFWGSFTVGRVLGALIAHITSPGMLLLSGTPFAILGSLLPIIFTGKMTYSYVMLTAAMTGLGNSVGYANAVALLERYVPVTGFINGVFGAVAGGACMVGPTLVAVLAKYTSLGYDAMAWVALVFYALHVPAVAVTLLVGDRLLAHSFMEALEPLMESEQRQLSRAFSATPSDPLDITANYDFEARRPRTSLPGHGSPRLSGAWAVSVPGISPARSRSLGPSSGAGATC